MSTDRALLLQRGRALEVFTITWNSAEGMVAVLLGLLAGSISLVGFGIDSFIEMSSGVILLWRLQTRRDEASAERAEAVALRLVGLSLLGLAAFIVYDSAVVLRLREAPAVSLPGIALAGVSLIVMPVLAQQKRRVAAAINSRALEADTLQTILCMYLSAILLAGLAANALFGWWWADPIAALAMTPFIAKEGVEALRGERGEGCAYCGTPACICG